MYFTIVASDSDIQHHGIKGQKWGVRRYQNYDGTYTKRGLERYNKAVDKYNTTKQNQIIGLASRKDVRAANKEVNAAYKQLKNDKLADEGKELYKRGKRITTNSMNSSVMQTGVVVGAAIARNLIGSYGNQKIANISAAAIGIGGTAVNAIIFAKSERENRRIRAYYSH